jgi:hypothetical protein
MKSKANRIVTQNYHQSLKNLKINKKILYKKKEVLNIYQLLKKIKIIFIKIN